MTTQARQSSNSLELFADWYRRKGQAGALRLIEREVFGTSVGVNSYTTVAQADALAGALRLGPGKRLLDIGAGSGWPGLYLAKKTGCEVVLTDLPPDAIRNAVAQASKQGVHGRSSFALASGTHLPFRPRTFDATAHTDVLC